jgi:plasmid stabilization system protein ParE
MNLSCSSQSLRDLREIYDEIAREQPATAKRIIRRIEAAASLIASFPDAWRPLRRRHLYVFAVPKD